MKEEKEIIEDMVIFYEMIFFYRSQSINLIKEQRDLVGERRYSSQLTIIVVTLRKYYVVLFINYSLYSKQLRNFTITI